MLAAVGAGAIVALVGGGAKSRSPREALTFVSTAAIIVVATMAAGYFPAHRASRLDPAVVLRTE